MTKKSFDVVSHYAGLQLARQRYLDAGQPVPLMVTRAIQGIEARAATTLTPEQINDALRQVEVIKTQLITEETAQLHERSQQQRQDDLERMTREFSKGMLGETEGLDPHQFMSLVKGEKVTIPSRAPRFDREAVEAQTRAQTKRLDPNGKGYSLAEWEKRLDELADASPESFEKLVKQYKAKPEQLRKAADKWKTDRYGYEMNKRQVARNGNPKDEVVEPTDDVVRRAQLSEAFMEDINDDNAEYAAGAVRQELLEEDGRHGDVARAFIEVESREANYG